MNNRKIKKNIWGNWNGYLGRNRHIEFGTCEITAAYWLLTGTLDWYGGFSKEWYEQCKAVADAGGVLVPSKENK